MQDSSRETFGYEEVFDFEMSKVFGLDWIKHDSIRMRQFHKMLGFEKERQLKQQKKQQPYGRH